MIPSRAGRLLLVTVALVCAFPLLAWGGWMAWYAIATLGTGSLRGLGWAVLLLLIGAGLVACAVVILRAPPGAGRGSGPTAA